MKYCWECKNNKALADFYKNKSKKDGHHDSCKKCSEKRRKERIAKDPERERKRCREKVKRNRNSRNLYEKRFRQANPDKAKHYYLKKTYKISFEDYSKMLVAQDYKCAICKMPETSKHQKGKVRDLAVDHDHSNGKIRALLCVSCNRGLGFLKENLDTAINLAKYIQEHKGII